MNNDPNANSGYRAADYSASSMSSRPVAQAAPAAAVQNIYTPDYSEATLERLQGSHSETDLSDDDIRLRRKLQKRKTRHYFAWAGVMMIIFTVVLSFASSYIGELVMCAAIPEKVSEVISEGGLAGVSDFYYNDYAAEGGEYYATYGLTENISYCLMVVLYCLIFTIFMLCTRTGKLVFHKGSGFTAPFFISAYVIGIGLLNMWADGYAIAAEYVKSLDLNYIFELFEQNSNAAFASVGGTIAYFVATCIFAPFGEEFVCRGVLLSYLRKYGDWFAILITAMLFGLMHANFYQGPYAFLMGVVFGYVTVKTGNIWCSILMHMLNNTISTVNEIATEFLPAVGEYVNYAFTGLYMAAMPAAIVLLIIFAVKHKIHLDKPEVLTPELETKAKGLKYCLTWPNLLFILFCLLNCILLIIPSYTALLG